MTKIEQLQEIIDSSENIVFFGGAGVSTESGIPDFRSADGIYSKTPEELVSHTYYFEHTEEFFEFYKENLIFKDAEPNPAHYKLAELEKKGKLKAVITQNIDGLHQKAGSKNVLELHGSVHRNYCQICNKSYDLDYILSSDGIPRCECGGIIKPDVVLWLLQKSLKAFIPCSLIKLSLNSLLILSDIIKYLSIFHSRTIMGFRFSLI